jgi:hypothetical protein
MLNINIQRKSSFIHVFHHVSQVIFSVLNRIVTSYWLRKNILTILFHKEQSIDERVNILCWNISSTLAVVLPNTKENLRLWLVGMTLEEELVPYVSLTVGNVILIIIQSLTGWSKVWDLLHGHFVALNWIGSLF